MVACPRWLGGWLPSPVLSVADTVLGIATSAVGAVVGAVTGGAATEQGDDDGSPHAAREGERVQLEVITLTPSPSSTAA
jgi:hypothetical protein